MPTDDDRSSFGMGFGIQVAKTVPFRYLVMLRAGDLVGHKTWYMLGQTLVRLFLRCTKEDIAGIYQLTMRTPLLRND